MYTCSPAVILQSLLSFLKCSVAYLFHLRVLTVSSTLSVHTNVCTSKVRRVSISLLRLWQAFLVGNRHTSSLNMSNTDICMTRCLSVQRVSSVGQPRLTQSNIDENSLPFLWHPLMVSLSYATESLKVLTDVAHPSLNSRDFVVILSKTGLPLTVGSWRRLPTTAHLLTQTSHYHQTALPISSACTPS